MQDSQDSPLPKRPRYLLVALVVALLFGAGCWIDGCGRLSFYRGEQDHTEALNEAIKNEADRTHAETLYRQFVDVADNARKRAIPLAAATFVLGAALLTLAARGLGARMNTRRILVQVVIVQAVVVGASYYLMRDVQNAELDWQIARTLAERRESMPQDQYERLVPMMESVRRFGAPSWLVVRTIASALVVLALTRRGAREFFETVEREHDGPNPTA